MFKTDKTIRDIFNNMNNQQREIAYEMIGRVLDGDDYDREALVMFNKEEQMVMKFLLLSAMKFYI